MMRRNMQRGQRPKNPGPLGRRPEATTGKVISYNSYWSERPAAHSGPLETDHLQDLDMELALLKRKREIVEQQQNMLLNKPVYKRLNRYGFDESNQQYGHPLFDQQLSNQTRYFSNSYDDGLRTEYSRFGRQQGIKRQVEDDWRDSGDFKRFGTLSRGKPKQSGNRPVFNPRLPSLMSEYMRTDTGSRPSPRMSSGFWPTKPKPVSKPHKDFNLAKVTKPKPISGPEKLNSYPEAARKQLIGQASSSVAKAPFVLSADQPASRQVLGRLELALGHILKEIKKKYGNDETYVAVFQSFLKQRALKQAIRDRIHSTMIGKVVGSMADIVEAYRAVHPTQTDSQLLKFVLDCTPSTSAKPTPVQTENPGKVIRANFNKVLSQKLDEMFVKLKDVYALDSETSGTVQEIVNKLIVEHQEATDTDEKKGFGVESKNDDKAFDDAKAADKSEEKVAMGDATDTNEDIPQEESSDVKQKDDKVVDDSEVVDKSEEKAASDHVKDTKEDIPQEDATEYQDVAQKDDKVVDDSEVVDKSEQKAASDHSKDTKEDIPQKDAMGSQDVKQKDDKVVDDSEVVDKSEQKAASDHSKDTKEDIPQEDAMGSQDVKQKDCKVIDGSEIVDKSEEKAASDHVKNTKEDIPQEDATESRDVAQSQVSTGKKDGKNESSETYNKHGKVIIDISAGKDVGKELLTGSQQIFNARFYTRLIDVLLKRRLPQVLPRYKETILKILLLDESYKTAKATVKSNSRKQNIDKECAEPQTTGTETEPAMSQNKPVARVIPYFVKVLGRPYLPKKHLMQTFLDPYHPQTIKKHRSIHNLLFVGFGEKEDFEKILTANETVIGTSIINIKVSERTKANKQTSKDLDQSDAEMTQVKSQEEKITDLLSFTSEEEEKKNEEVDIETEATEDANQNGTDAEQPGEKSGDEIKQTEESSKENKDSVEETDKDSIGQETNGSGETLENKVEEEKQDAKLPGTPTESPTCLATQTPGQTSLELECSEED